MNITNMQEKEVIRLKNELNLTGKEISKKTGLTINQVYDVFKRRGITNKNNKIFNINSIQEQIILSGILGDGRLKKNGKYNYYYSECHSLEEYDYCKWKMDALSDLTDGNTLYYKNINNQSSTAVEFCTKTTPSLIKYAKMCKIEVISQLNLIGIVLFLLDDGWFRKDTKSYMISGGNLTDDELLLFCNVCKFNGLQNVHITGIKRKDISIPKINSLKLYCIATSLIPDNYDIISKKFGYYNNLNIVMV